MVYQLENSVFRWVGVENKDAFISNGTGPLTQSVPYWAVNKSIHKSVLSGWWCQLGNFKVINKSVFESVQVG